MRVGLIGNVKLRSNAPTLSQQSKEMSNCASLIENKAEFCYASSLLHHYHGHISYPILSSASLSAFLLVRPFIQRKVRATAAIFPDFNISYHSPMPCRSTALSDLTIAL
ncbi:hypothetical protein C8J56DRAFT_1052507 [Mycena floridula]|nr:hypothetical protein C8J56DRAFT_1052507 [Mycena floridula]